MNRYTTANDLRKAAEYADGHRNEEIFLVYRPARIPGDDREGVIAVRKPHGNDKVYCSLKTPFKAPGSKMSLTPMNYIEARSGFLVWKNLADRPRTPDDEPKWNFDSLFWSEAAIEKFLVPYYASFFSEEEMRWLYRAYTDKDVYALGHRVPTVYGPLKSEDDDGEPPPPFEFSEAFHTVGVLTLETATQTAEVISLAEYARRKAYL